MKKIVFLSLFALCLPLGMMAQSNDDDLYFVPSKDKEEPAPVKKVPAKREVTTNIYTTPGTTVVVQDRKGNTRDVDEYNRRYDSRDNEFTMENDTLVIKEKSRPGLEGEWVNGEFEGSQDDYEYAERIIRFRNPRYAISISSPLYWDVVYGANSWDWNVYTDGLYAYAFPTFSNRLWWDWRYNSFGGGWGWGYPYYGWGGYPGYWGGSWGGHWGHHHHGVHYPSWGAGGGHWSSNTTYTNRRSYGNIGTSTNRRSDSYGTRTQSRRTGTVSSDRRASSSTEGTRRVVGTRSSSARTGVSTRAEGSSSRRSTYTRPSSTRSSSDVDRANSVRSSRVVDGSSSRSSSSTYNRGSSTQPSRSSSSESTRRSYDNNNSSSRSYTPSSSSSSRSSSSYSGSSSSGSSSRSSGGGGSSSGGGGSSRSSRR